MDGALKWDAGSVDAVGSGGQPTPAGTFEEVAALNGADLDELSNILQRALEAKRGRPLTETQRRVTKEMASSFEQTIEAVDEEAG